MEVLDTKIECRGIWKVFGHGADEFLAKCSASPSNEALKQRGLIGAVRDASFGVAHAETFVIMGLSGSGKSTLVRCLSRLVEPSAGQILFEGQDLRSVSERDLMQIRRHKMGMVFQHFALMPHMSVLANVAFPLEIQGMDRPEREARAREVIELVGLDGRENNYPRELSGGQQQRVGIARSLAVEPDIWFLDEPFSALDPLIRREMQDEFIRLQNVLHKTIVFITHDFNEAIRLADRIAIMDNGEIVQIGTPEALVLNPANDYVREFTHDIPRAKVLSAGSIMRPIDESGAISTLTISQNDLIENVAEVVLSQASRVVVLGNANEPVGELHPQDVLQVLVGQNVQT